MRPKLISSRPLSSPQRPSSLFLRSFKAIGTAIVCLSVSLGCAQRWRESSSGVDVEYVRQKFDNAYSGAASSGAIDGSLFQSARSSSATPGSVLYYAESQPSNQRMGPPDAVADMNIGFLLPSQNWLPTYALSHFHATFVVAPVNGDKNRLSGALFLEFRTPSDSQPVLSLFVADGQSLFGQVSDEKMVMDMVSSTGIRLRVETDDVDTTTHLGLHPVVSLDIWDVSGGQPLYRGRINSLEGFGI